MYSKDIIRQIDISGFALIQKLEPTLSTEDIAQKIGSILDISTLLPEISKVQTLKPRRPSDLLRNQYSGTFGFGEFPLHSDLAHWNIPPRYLLLRCKIGAADVKTQLLPYSAIISEIDQSILNRALVIPRRKNKGQIISPMPVIFRHNEIVGMRWDFLFLTPLNDAGQKTSELLSSCNWSEKGLLSVTLLNPGDTVIIDNWKMLHGRSAVSDASIDREIQRIYLNKLEWS